MKKISNLLVIVAVIGIMAIGVSFGYFVMSASITGKGAETNVSTSEGMRVIYDAGDNTLVGNNMLPGVGSVSKGFKVTVVPTTKDDTVTYAIKFVIDSNGFVKCDDTNYSLANACDKGAEELIYTLKTSDGTIIKTGDLTGKSGEVILAKETKTVTAETDFNYIIEITYKDTDAPQNHNMNKSIEGKIKVEFATYGITIPDIIAANSPKEETPTFSSVATTDEGVYKVSDGMYSGDSYYWRGAVTNNYVKFANKCWRIIRINGDGTMRLIYDGATCHANGTKTAESIAKTSIQYNASYNQSNYVGWTYTGTSQRTTGGTASNAKTQLESWYSSNITGTNATKVADGKYCNDRNVTAAPSSWSGYVTTWSATGTQFAYAGPKRLYETYAPTLSCPSGDVYTLKVGLITADEVELAGGKNENNTSYYLYNGQNYWTMSPFDWNYGNASVFFVRNDGHLGSNWAGGAYGLRPVINLKADTLFKEGTNGTQLNPYEVL